MKSLKVLTVVLFFAAFATSGLAQTDPASAPVAVSEFQKQYLVELRTEVYENGRTLFDDYSGVLAGDQYVLTIGSPLVFQDGARTSVMIKSKDWVSSATLVSYKDLGQYGIALFELAAKVPGYLPFRFPESTSDNLYLVTAKDILRLPLLNQKIEKPFGTLIINERGELGAIVIGIENDKPNAIPWLVFEDYQKIIDIINGADKSIKEIGFDKI